MITLYGMGSPNVVKIFIALEELGLPYHVEPVDVFNGKQFDEAFLKRNPSAKVPVIVDPDGPGGKPYTVFESGAILLYLAEKTGQLLPKQPTERYDVIQWMMVQMTGVGPMFGQYVHFMRFAPPGNDYARARYATQVHRVFQVIEDRLAASPYLGGAEYSIADVATFPWARNLPVLMGAEAAARYPAVARWVATLDERPAIKSALGKVDAVRSQTTAFDKADPDHVDRMMGRGRYAA